MQKEQPIIKKLKPELLCRLRWSVTTGNEKYIIEAWPKGINSQYILLTARLHDSNRLALEWNGGTDTRTVSSLVGTMALLLHFCGLERLKTVRANLNKTFENDVEFLEGLKALNPFSVEIELSDLKEVRNIPKRERHNLLNKKVHSKTLKSKQIALSL